MPVHRIDASRVASGVLSALLALMVGCASARIAESPIDWAGLDDWSVFIVTEDEDGSPRETRIWIAVVDGAGVIRTRNSRWWGNLQRGSASALRVGGVDYPMEVEGVIDAKQRQRADAAFLAKYGWQESMLMGPERAASQDPYLRLTAAER